MSQPEHPHPRVSVILPAYHSERTIAGCLETLRAQSFADFEIVVVDSAPDNAVEAIVTLAFPEVRYVHSPERLLPHAARRLGTAHARGELLVFTDPDLYFAPDWLERLLAAEPNDRRLVIGAVSCEGRRWLDVGIHLSKYDYWLPGGPARRLEFGHSAALVCTRRLYEALGGFAGDVFVGDSALTYRARLRGAELRFAPAAVARHHHLQNLSGFLRERLRRGHEFACLRPQLFGLPQSRVPWVLLTTLLPLRLLKLLARVGLNAWRARLLGDYLRTLPLLVLGQSAWLAGEARGYVELLRRGRPAVRTGDLPSGS